MNHGPIQLTEANLDAILGTKGIVVLDFWADWCGPCRAFAPIFEAAARKHPEAVFAKVNTETERSLAAAFQIRSIPTIGVIADGQLVYLQPGALSARSMDSILEQASKLATTSARKEA